LVRRTEVRRPAEEPRDVLREHVEDFAGGVAAGDALGISREDGKVAIPSRGEVAPLHQIDLVRELGIRGAVRRQELGPPAARGSAARTDPGGEVLADAIRYQELGIFRPPVAALRETNLVVAERLAVRRRRILFIRGAVADMRVEDDQRWAARRLA